MAGPVLWLILGFIFLVKGADWLVSGASALARRLGVSDFVIGLTVVAFGTSTPELFVNILAAVRDSSGIAIGNIVGSNIFNIYVVLGLSTLIYPLAVSRGTVWKEIPMSLVTALFLFVLLGDTALFGAEKTILGRIDAAILLAGFAGFLLYTVFVASRVPGLEEQTPHPGYGLGRVALYCGIGLAALVLGGRWVVLSATEIAGKLGISDAVIGLTVVAVGTSLPELVTSLVAAWKKNAEIAVGNVVGSNIFNVLFILGTTGLIRPLTLQDAALLDQGVMILGHVLLFLFMFTGKRRKLDRWEGAVFILFYIGYVSYQVKRVVGG
ncbi:MAG: calcium/sodium antiporter [Sedimentisphaerales bacterium]|nr:calcium/sodium antiporter [Sedimentisphaerales bacterium]